MFYFYFKPVLFCFFIVVCFYVFFSMGIVSDSNEEIIKINKLFLKNVLEVALHNCLSNINN